MVTQCSLISCTDVVNCMLRINQCAYIPTLIEKRLMMIGVYVSFKIIYVISRRWKVDIERLCAMKELNYASSGI